MTPFSAVLLAGGQSRRMGRDKALLRLPDGRLLWERQLDVLRALRPAELFISGPRRDGFPPPAAVRCLPDGCAGRGPLGGIATALAAMTSPRLVVLAVDLPAMTTAFLSRLLALGDQQVAGVVPRHRRTGLHEPLAALYPQACAGPAAELLAGEDWSMRTFLRTTGPLLRTYEIADDEAGWFANWNHPGDVISLSQSPVNDGTAPAA